MRVLAVDLDGTLIKTDLFEESLIRFITEQPLRVILVLIWWLKGRAFLKQQIARRIKINIEALPYNTEVLEWLKQQKATGKTLSLVSGSDQSYVSAVAEHCKTDSGATLFDKAKGSDGVVNCIGSNKAAWLEQEYGERNFDYVGNSRVDLKVWKRSHSAFVVSSSLSPDNLEKRFAGGGFSIAAFIKAIRVHQWVKAILIFIPLFAAHRIFDEEAWLYAILAFFSFCFMSSATYLFNDIVDLESDRRNPNKKKRPFAAGTIRPAFGVIGAGLLFVASVLIAFNISDLFLFLILGYALGTLTYSLHAKSWVIADIVLLAGFYTVRILAGGVACQIPVSKWLLLFSIFFFLGLACIKRFCELASIESTAGSRRGYQKSDLPLVRVMGLCSGFIAVLVVALWANSPEIVATYSSPQFLWILCPVLLYWVGRIWILAERGALHHDPIVFALQDRVSYGIVVLGLFLVYMSASFRLESVIR